MPKYDYAIVGTGCAGLSLAYYISLNESLKDKKILLLDAQPKNQNDRTWCFWHTQATAFDAIAHNKWQKLHFFGENFEKVFNISPYTYTMLRGIDFYNFILQQLTQNPQFDIVYEQVNAIKADDQKAFIHTSSNIFEANWVFSSIPTKPSNGIPKGYHFLKQHFKGWIIETPKPSFEPHTAGFMDFRTPQKDEARFFYVLPSSPTEALVEFTIFSENLLTEADYENAITEYIENVLKIKDFAIKEEEFGVIPMIDAPVQSPSVPFVSYIGTVGGDVKASSGYAFLRIQQRMQHLTDQLAAGKKPDKIRTSKNKYNLYDGALLNVIATNKYSAKVIFTRMFEKHPIHRIFRFLDEESSFWEDLQIMYKMPHKPFIKAIAENTYNRL